MRKYERHSEKQLNPKMNIRDYYSSWYYYDYDDDDDFYQSYGDTVYYDFLEQEDVEEIKWRHAYYRKKFKNLYFPSSFGRGGSHIDMNSIYSKEVLRQKKIDQILGNTSEYLSNTIENIMKMKLKN